jgi:uncharacterized repeat protein (TIGR02543 family)
MKCVFRRIGIIGLAAVIVLMLAGCENPIDGGNNSGDSTETGGKTYTVSFESNGGTEVAAQTVASGGKVTQPAAPTRVGHFFAGWYRDADLTTTWNFSSGTVNADITLYAKWTSDASAVTYTVSFESSGGSPVETQTVASGDRGYPTRRSHQGRVPLRRLV